MEWEVNYTDQFEDWWNTLDADEQESIDTKVILLQRVGPSLGRPHADVVHSSKHSHMKELIIQHQSDPYRVFFAFDPHREGILLLGGNKGGDKKFYAKFVPIADALYDEHLKSLEKEADKDG
ncbi:MAG: type II toxin-antitoxin system RelE/ParE family toxin [Acidobacteria bacterium]|nr:type II toxin-antitoxin system RelE/ParE family toxin [Acidobacteriota bacterium]